MSDHIEIKIDASKINPEKFLEVAREFFALVQGVAKNITVAQIDWSIEVDKGSAIMRMRALNPTADSAKSIETVCQGVGALRNGVKAVPNGFTKREVNAARIIAGVNDGAMVRAISIQNGGKPVDMPISIVKVADAILSGQNHIAFGSVEGKIVSMSIRHGFSCTLLDPIQQREIVCYLQKDDVQQEAIRGFSKQLRVLAGGLIHYAKEGYAVNITADTIRLFPPDSELPTVEDIQEIYRLYK